MNSISKASLLLSLLVATYVTGLSSILEVIEDPNLSILSQAIEAADLAPFFNNANLQATLFAPTDEAFMDLLVVLNTTLEALLSDQEYLINILLYHVIDEVDFLIDFSEDLNLQTRLVNNCLAVRLEDGVEIVGAGSTATIIIPDIEAGANVVHVVDSVLLPFSIQEDQPKEIDKDSIVSVVQEIEFSILVKALEAAELADELSNSSKPFTLFAPTEDAFQSLFQQLGKTLEELSEEKEILSQILSYHVVPQTLFSTDFQDGQELQTLLQGKTLKVEIQGLSGKIIGNSSVAQIEQLDVEAGKGVIHLIDTVLLPLNPEDLVKEEEEIREEQEPEVPEFVEKIKDGIDKFFTTAFGLFGIKF